MIEENDDVVMEERAVLEKFEGDPIPENCTERLILFNGVIMEHQFLENGRVVKTNKKGVESHGNN